MLRTEVPAREELVARASALEPLLREKAVWSDENRRLHDEVIEAMADAGVTKMRIPKRFGGYESDACTLVDVAAALGRGDGSAAWVATVYWIPSWIVGQFPEAVQQEVFSTPDVRICGTLSPTAVATPVDGGIVLDGRWRFVSGAPHAHWQEMSAIMTGPDGERVPVMALAPMSELVIEDDWHTSGLRGSGSVTTIADGIFVPAERMLPLSTVQTGREHTDSPVYRVPLLAAASVSAVGAVLGMARAAMQTFMERLPNSKITYTDYPSRRAAPPTHLQVAEASLKIDAAGFHAHRMATTVDTKAATREPWSLAERARMRADQGAASHLAKEATDLLLNASGGSSVYTHHPLQRIARDIHAVCLHALINPNTNTELYGRILCGQPPNTHQI